MMTELHTVSALKRLFKGVPGVQVSGYGTDFDEIWCLEVLPSGKHAIVVWADTPADPNVRPVATEQHLTPFDWALAARCRHPKLQVTVLDLSPTTHDAAGYAALQWQRTQRPECVPWLLRASVATLAATSSIDEVKEALVPSPPTPGDAPTIEPRKVFRGVPICEVDIDPSARHHAITNLLGPLLFLPTLDCTPPQPEAPVAVPAPPNHREALRQILLSAGVLEAGHEGGSRKPLTSHRSLRVVLLDDQWHQGELSKGDLVEFEIIQTAMCPHATKVRKVRPE